MLPLLAPAVPLPKELTRAFLLHHYICPKAVEPNGDLIVAVTSKSIIQVTADIEALYGRHVVTEMMPAWEVERLIEHLTADSERTADVLREAGTDPATDARDLANQPPVIRYVNLLLRDAYDASASDIHLEATATGLSVRFRVDGVLTKVGEPPANLQEAILSRIKLLADVDIAERRKPQDGRIRARLDVRDLDLRISTIPTIFGESVVLRLLDHGGRPATLDDLGMPPAIHATMTELSARTHGMVLVTGPTGSGKTTTLYGALLRRDALAEKIITVEDPIEYELRGITQMPVHRNAAVTFATALRALLRQDPDVLMIGEMRDVETAEIATQAAMTGHLVFSTLHTNDAISAIPRLLDLGIPDYAVAASLEGVLAQRLVRRICDGCRTDSPVPPRRVFAIDVPNFDTSLTHGAGCEKCRGTGYRGRVGVFEIVRVDDRLREAIASRASPRELRSVADAAGFVPLSVDGWQKIRAGLTTIEELSRVVQN
jgi:general secretion pathway protein E